MKWTLLLLTSIILAAHAGQMEGIEFPMLEIGELQLGSRWDQDFNRAIDIPADEVTDLEDYFCSYIERLICLTPQEKSEWQANLRRILGNIRHNIQSSELEAFVPMIDEFTAKLARIPLFKLSNDGDEPVGKILRENYVDGQLIISLALNRRFFGWEEGV